MRSTFEPVPLHSNFKEAEEEVAAISTLHLASQKLEQPVKNRARTSFFFIVKKKHVA